MILSRSKAAGVSSSFQQTLAKNKSEPSKQLSLAKFIETRDFLGALSLLEYEKSSGHGSTKTDDWIAYASFHSGDFKRALLLYESAGSASTSHAALCYFYLGLYEEALQLINKLSGDNPLKNRLLFHLSHKLGDEDKVLELHTKLKDVAEDQLSLAAVHYLRAHYQEAIDIYKRLLSEQKEFVALQAYIALCYYKLDYYDVSQEVLSMYLQKNPDSLIAVNLKACNVYRLYNGRAAENEFKPILDANYNALGRDLIQHNLIVFRQGEGALQVLPKLMDSIPEARLNLDDVNGANNLVEQIQPTLPNEYILKGIVNAVLAQETGIKEYMDIAQQYLQLVGSSSSECDTIPGRQCMASVLFLQRQFGDSHLYLNSIRSYFANDDTFNYNFGQVLTFLGQYKEAEAVLMQIHSEKLRLDLTYLCCLSRSMVMNRKARQAWDLYKRLDTSPESLGIIKKDCIKDLLLLSYLEGITGGVGKVKVHRPEVTLQNCVLQLLANDCYRTGQFLVAARSFEILWKYDPSAENTLARTAACAGQFQMVVAGREPRDTLPEVLAILVSARDSQCDIVARGIRNWARDNNVKL